MREQTQRWGSREATRRAVVTGASAAALSLFAQRLGAAPTGVVDVPPAGGPKDPGPTESASCERIAGLIGRNHGHELVVAPEDVIAAKPRTYALKGKADHPHSVEVTAEEFRALGQGAVVRKRTERGGSNAHRHRVLLRCEPLQLPPEKTNVCIFIAGQDDHELVVTDADLHGGVDRTYDIQGIAGHTHQLTIAAKDFERILGGKQVDLTTGYGLDHFHHVYIRYVR
jgi:hypothetical protein